MMGLGKDSYPFQKMAILGIYSLDFWGEFQNLGGGNSNIFFCFPLLGEMI